jgi:deoxycytidylate deaminase
MVINANIIVVYFEEGYADELSDQMFQEAGIQLSNWKSPDGGGE